MNGKISISEIMRLLKKRREKKEYLNEKLCPYCNGSGINSQSPTDFGTMQPQRCSICGGRGRIPR